MMNNEKNQNLKTIFIESVMKNTKSGICLKKILEKGMDAPVHICMPRHCGRTEAMEECERYFLIQRIVNGGDQS